MNQRRRRATQQDIARLAGVSQATVSLVINGGAPAQLIKESTRDAVLAAAAELGYAVNPAARSLRAAATGCSASTRSSRSSRSTSATSTSRSC